MIDWNHNLPPGCLASDLSGKDDLPSDWHERRETIMAEQAQAQAEDERFWRHWFVTHATALRENEL